MDDSLDATELYIELLELDEQSRRERLAQIAQIDLEIANDLADMLEIKLDEDEQESGLSSFVQFASQGADLTGFSAMGFTIVSPLSESGGMGRIYLGEQIVKGSEGQSTTHQAAIKVLRRDVISAKNIEKYFFREASSLIELDHPNICRVYGFDNIEGSACIVMEYIQGTTLEAWLETQPSQTARLEVLHQLCQALKYAHAQHIFHGDLKPQNIMITPEQKLKLIDLGLAKRIEQSHLSSGELSYIQGYSEKWSSPEQKQGRWSYSQSDVYSMGLIIQTLFAGVTLRRTTEAEFAAIIAKATAAKPQQRYFSAAELYLDITRSLNHFPVDVYRTDAFYRVGKQLRRHPWRFGSVALTLCSVAVFVALTLKHNGELQRKQRSSEQVIAQMEKTLSNNLPSLSYYYQAQSVDSLYQYAAKNWLLGESELELDAKYQTGIGLISGLFDTQQIDLAEELLARLENDSWDYKQQLSIDRWAFRIAGAQYLHTNYALGGSMAVEQEWLKNPHLIEAVDYNQDKLADYFSLIDVSKRLSFDELLTAFYALGVIRPYSLDEQQARYTKLQQLLLDNLKQDEWRTLSASQQIELLALYSSYTANNSILNHLAAQDYLKPLPAEIDRELTRLLAQRDQYSLSELSQIRYIATRSKDEQVVLARSEIEQLLTSQTDRKPTEFLTMAKTASMVLTSFDYRENQQLIQQYQADLIEQFTGHSAGMLEAVNKQMMNALELGMVTKAQELSLLSVHPSVSQNPQYNQSGLLQSEILIALYQRDMPPIADFAEQFMQFEQRRFQYYLDYVGEVSETIKRSYFGSEYPLMLAASNKDWSGMDKIAKQQQLSSFGWRAFISYLYQIGGQPERAMAILGDVASWHDFTDTPMWLAEDVKNEVIFLYGRKKPGAASEALSSLKRYAEIEQYEQQTDSYHAAKNYLFQYGLALRSRSDINEINRIKGWLQSSSGLSELPASYQSYYQKLLSLDE